MITIEQKKDCCGCNACGDICPQNAISFNTDNEGFWYPSIDQSKCVNCGLCDKVCPMQNEYRTSGAIDKPECYAAEHKSVEVVFSSTTGGMFSAMADVMYKRKGYVGGAIHNSDFSVSEFISNDKKDLDLLRRSKDLQSDAIGFYLDVKKLLNDGESVHVCALPCQIAALKTFLGKDYDNLITIDLICLGVNSPKVWRKYLDYIEKLNNSKIVWTENKSKEYGWHNLTQKFVFENGKEYFDTSNTSLFIKGFIKSHLYCRPSCYDCQFKKFPRPADISIGDFWGIERRDSFFNSNMGTSVVIVNTKKGKTFFEDVKKRIIFKETPLEWVLSGNPALTRSITDISDKRKEFFDELECSPFDVAIEKYGNLDKKSAIVYDLICHGKFDQLAKCAIFCAEGGLISANPARRYGEYGYQEFLDEMLSLGGIDKRLLLNEKALKSHLHIIKKDFDILAQFKYDGGIIEQDITVIYSEHDSTCINMDEWGKITVGNISYKTLGDNHFFLNQCYKEMADIINNQLKEWIY